MTGHKKMTQRTNKNIRTEMLGGYFRVIILIVVLAAVMITSLFCIRYEYLTMKGNQSNQNAIQTAIIGHYEWLEMLNVSIQSGAEFSGSLDYNTCALGKWKADVSNKDLENPVIRQALEAANVPHEQMHTMVKDILTLSKTDKEAAYEQYINTIKPKTAEVIKQLQIIDSNYQVAVDKSSRELTTIILIAVCSTTALTIGVTIFAVIYAKKVSSAISEPIVAVSEWAQKLALGVDDLQFNAIAFEGIALEEVNTLIKAFEVMTKSIQDNVSVVKRVAEGDMTAFVNIHSRQDSLGKNLYRMVQSNDILFNEIVHVAHDVLTGSDEIAKVSLKLSESAGVQAGAVQELSETIGHASELLFESNQKSNTANTITQQVKMDIEESSIKMEYLKESVNNIRIASERISTVIKAIEDIAFQTNILALNAAVEAARAGESGKGFSVVASEVRNLASKCTEAVKESKVLIDDAIQKTGEGSKDAEQTASMFTTIIAEMNQIADIIAEMTSLSQEQFEGIEQVNQEIKQISEVATSNAGVSEQSAVFSKEIRGNAESLRNFMGKFHLREREKDHAYIPPEKANDIEFIRCANEAFKEAKESGRYGHVYIDPNAKALEDKL